MKRKIWLKLLLVASFSCMLSVSAVGCLVTGFDLNVSSMGRLLCCCGLLSLFCALLFQFKYGGAVTLCLSALAAILLWKTGTFWEQLQTLTFTITSHYKDIYAWPVLGAKANEDVELVLLALSWWTAVNLSWCISRRKHLIHALPFVILPLVLCLVTTDTVPDVLYLYLLILGVALLLMTDWVRRNDPSQGFILMLRMVLPVAAALGVLFFLNPKDQYVNNAGKLQKEAIAWFQQLQSRHLAVSVGNFSEAAVSQSLNLRNVGPKSRLSYAVMRVTSPISDTLYLRGQDYDEYTGLGWTASSDRSETFTSGEASEGTLTVITYGVRNVLYVPYYAAESTSLNGGCAENAGNLQRYSYDLSRTPAGNTGSFDSAYTALPYETLEWAKPLAEQIISGYKTQDAAIQAIGSYVRDSASYDLSTSRMSSDHQDFARWFLEESDTGYCIHFATAATVLLRAADIPARYVEGYMVSCRDGQEVVVSNQDAHAWAEYYDAASASWRVLEATPADENAEEETTLPESTTPTDAVPTEAPPETEKTSEIDETLPIPTNGKTDTAADPVPQKTPFLFPGWLKILMWFILVTAVLPIQGKLRLEWKRRLWNRGKPNEMALTRWKQSEQLAKMLNIPLPEELEALAQKAKFSQHTLAREELQQFESFRRESLQKVNAMPWYRKWFHRWILAIG